MAPSAWQKRVDSADWAAITAEVNDFGGALLPRLLTRSEAEKIRGLYPDDHLFRATIDMRRYRFGEGEYRRLRDQGRQLTIDEALELAITALDAVIAEDV